MKLSNKLYDILKRRKNWSYYSHKSIFKSSIYLYNNRLKRTRRRINGNNNNSYY